METKEKTFNLRLSLTAEMPAALLDEQDFDEDEWLNEWEVAMKPGLIRAVFAHLRSFPHWEAHIRNRGVSPLDEIEIVMWRNFSGPGSAARR